MGYYTIEETILNLEEMASTKVLSDESRSAAATAAQTLRALRNQVGFRWAAPASHLYRIADNLCDLVSESEGREERFVIHANELVDE